jgi:hypothetical protein
MGMGLDVFNILREWRVVNPPLAHSQLALVSPVVTGEVMGGGHFINSRMIMVR